MDDAVLDLSTKLPVHLFWGQSATRELTFLDQFKAVIPPGTLLLLDRGFVALPFFDWLTDHACWFVIRAKAGLALAVTQVLRADATVRDQLIALGQYRSSPCQHPVRLIEVNIGGGWHRYLINVLDPATLSASDVVALYRRRWRIEDAFLVVKRLLGLAYLWVGSPNGIQGQVWATRLPYAVLVDLGDAVADELQVPSDRISLENDLPWAVPLLGGLYGGPSDRPSTVTSEQVKEAAKEAMKGVGCDLLLVLGFRFDAHAGETAAEFQPEDEDALGGFVAERRLQYGKLPIVLVRISP